MSPKIHSSFWSDPDVEKLTPEQKLCFLWLMTNPQLNVCGFCQISAKRFSFETGLHERVLNTTIEALPRALKPFQEVSIVYLRKFIRHQLGDGEQLLRNNIFKSVMSVFSGIKHEPLKQAILEDYPVMEGLQRASQNSGSPCKGKGEGERTGTRKGEGGGAGGGEAKTAEEEAIEQARIVLFYLNEKAGRSFREIGENLKTIAARLLEVKGDLGGVKLMIDRKVNQWKGDPKMEEYLRPATLFAKSNFHSYYDDRNTPVFLPAITNRKEVTDEQHAEGF